MKHILEPCSLFNAELKAKFKNKFGYMNFRQLIGLDLRIKEGLKEHFIKVHDYACTERIRFTVKRALEILQG